MEAVLEVALRAVPTNKRDEAESAMEKAKPMENFMLSHRGREIHGWVMVGMASRVQCPPT